MTSVEIKGGLGNQIIRILAVNLIAEKHNLNVNYNEDDFMKKLGIELFNGSNKYELFLDLYDYNYFEFYNSDNLEFNLFCEDYFQTKEITNLIYSYLHTDKIKSKIIQNNPFKERYNKNNDLFIHVRLNDVAQYNPGVAYYINATKIFNFDNLYISTDDKNHNIITELLHNHPCAKLIEFDEIKTFQFASTCKNIILSHGSFFAIIGYLSFFSNIYYPEYEVNKMWHGDMFSIDNWNKLKINLRDKIKYF
jgi:hypothetical protein